MVLCGSIVQLLLGNRLVWQYGDGPIRLLSGTVVYRHFAQRVVYRHFAQRKTFSELCYATTPILMGLAAFLFLVSRSCHFFQFFFFLF